jgi:hypothetical protein
MKTEDEVKQMLNIAITNGIRSGSIEELRYFQGQISILENLLGLTSDAFENETKPEEKKE